MITTDQKTHLRKALLEQRASLSLARREEAAHALYEKITSFVQDFSLVLSFANIGSEIDLWEVNAFLAQENKLVLPRVVDGELKLFEISSFDDLEKGFSNILEPKETSREVSLHEIDCALVPGLGFDRLYNRIGYGKGHYDRLLKDFRNVKIGVGFTEQLVDEIPAEEHDQKLDQLLLF